MNQPTTQQKHEVLNKILASPEFHDSKRYQELLQYLVDKSEKVESLKETEIAIEVFGKDSKFDPSTDPLIRSYISNLRKKLEHYYLTTSDSCQFRLEIPKGKYLVKYTYIGSFERIKKTKNYLSYAYPAIIALLAVIIIVREFQNRGVIVNSTQSNNLIWKEFFQKDSAPVLIAVGDYVVLSEKGKTRGRTFLRVPNINNEKELIDSVKNYPERFNKLEISDVSYIGAGAGLGMANILQLFSEAGIKPKIKLSREVTWDDIEKNNVIFLGTFKTLYKLDTLLARTNIRYGLNPNSLTVVSKNESPNKVFKLDWHGGNYERNYGLILKENISKKNNFILVTGFSEVGVMDAVKNILDPDFLTRMEKYIGTKFSESLPQFEFISEAEGLKHNVLRSKLKHFSLTLD